MVNILLFYMTIAAILACFPLCQPLSAAEQNVQIIFSDTTDSIRLDSYGMTASYISGNYQDLTARPPLNDYHDCLEWFFQRYQPRYDDQLDNRFSQRNWSAYHFLRFDVYSDMDTAVVGLQVKDASGPLLGAGYLGLFTPFAVYRIPPGQWYTCNFPLAEMAQINELDLTKMQGFFIRRNGYQGNTVLQYRNIRLVGSGDPDYPVIEMQGKATVLGRKVCLQPPTQRDPEKLARALGPIAPLGPVTVLNATGTFACAAGHFGGSGETYYQNLCRAPVAYDNDRLILLAKANVANAIQSKPGSPCENGGVLAIASFDGGQTWGGITRGESRPTNLTNWYWRAEGSADYSGDVYFIGVQNCASYHGNVDFFFRRLAFIGDGWVEDRFAILGQAYKCPNWSYALRLASGRLWATTSDGWGGITAKYSDDDGFAWSPCKNSALATPRPFYQSGVDPIPDSIVVYPGPRVPGQILVPYGNGVAVFSRKGEYWSIHDGTNWGAQQNLGRWGSSPFEGEYEYRYNTISATTIQNNQVFLCKGGRYSDGSTSVGLTDLLIYRRTTSGAWQKDTLVPENAVYDAIVTASGDFVYCFYFEKSPDSNYLVKYRKWNGVNWEPEALVATETVRINRLAAPQICPPTYAAIFWDQYNPGQPTAIKFVRVPTGVIVKAEEKATLPQLAVQFKQQPNPFARSTTFSYQLPGPCPVTIDIYDLNGRRIRQLTREYKGPGNHTSFWRPANLSSGIYYVHFKAGSFSLTKKIVYAN
ncbi:MAG: T9SS type A sorting domain-containing protein [Fibrobacterota bacterium]